MRVGFCGAGDTGKTTTAVLVADELGIPFLPSISRAVFADLGLTEADQVDMSDEDRWGLQCKILSAKRKQDSMHEPGVLDRTLLDHAAYCLYRCSGIISRDEYGRLIDEVGDNLRHHYDRVFYFPAGVYPPVDDGFRQGGLAYQTAIDCLIRGMLSRFDLPHVIVEPVLLDERVAFIHDIVSLGI